MKKIKKILKKTIDKTTTKRYNIDVIKRGKPQKERNLNMRYEIVAYNENSKRKDKDAKYIKTYSQVECIIKDWELRMLGYTTKIVVNEK